MRLHQPLATEKDLEKCFRLIQPCSSNRVPFDVLAPTVAASTVYVASKGAQLQNVAINQIMMPLVRKGEAGARRLSEAFRVFLVGIDHITEYDTSMASDATLAPFCSTSLTS